jgi:hypothetical protein
MIVNADSEGCGREWSMATFKELLFVKLGWGKP